MKIIPHYKCSLTNIIIVRQNNLWFIGMGKGNKKFINKQVGPTLRLLPSTQNPNDTNQEPVFQVVQKRMHDRDQEDKVQNLADIIQRKLNKGDYTVVNDKSHKPNKVKSSLGSSIPAHLAKQVEGRSDLWINQLQKQKAAEQIPSDDEDEWEDEDDDDDDEGSQDQNLKHEQSEFRKLRFHPSIKQRRFDEDGLPLDDGYDYSQHIVKASDKLDGDLVVDYYVKATEVHHITVDMDYQPEEMTEEQKEVFQSLQYEGEDNIYEELEDDFVLLANGGQECIISKEAKEPKNIQAAQTSKGQLVDSEEDDEEEMDSEAEREFEREMQNYESGSDQQEEEDDTLPDQQLNRIVDDHLKVMNQRKKGVGYDDQSVDDEPQMSKKDKELFELKEKNYLEYLKAKFPDTDPSEFHLPKDTPKLTLEQDIALQNYLNKIEDSSSGGEEREDKTEYDTIITRSFEQSQMSKISPDQLNIIKWQAFKKNKKPSKPKPTETKEAISNIKVKQHEQEVQTLQKLVRDRAETAEEKKLRKMLIKHLKKDKRDKKQTFKGQFKGIAKQHKDLQAQNRETQLLGAVKVQ